MYHLSPNQHVRMCRWLSQFRLGFRWGFFFFFWSHNSYGVFVFGLRTAIKFFKCKTNGEPANRHRQRRRSRRRRRANIYILHIKRNIHKRRTNGKWNGMNGWIISMSTTFGVFVFLLFFGVAAICSLLHFFLFTFSSLYCRFCSM